jgi:hypothetical protein
MRKFLGSGWFFLVVLVGGWVLFWWIDEPDNGYLNTQGSMMPPVVMSVLWPWIALCGFVATSGRRR